MNYSSANSYLLSLMNLPRREYLKNPRQAGVYLERMRELLKLLGNPENKIPHYVHITGTSGKGSVSRMSAKILQTSGYKVGLLTSPHPSIMLERFEINGRLMPRSDFIFLTEKLKTALEKFINTSKYDVPSFGELVTILGLGYFAKNKVDYAVLEVGCGGRLDYTNVIPHKDAAIITNIGLDHVEMIGPTKEKIAYEKSGIIMRGAKVFTMERDPKILKIIESECRKTKTKLVRVKKSEGKLISTNLNGTDFFTEEKKYHLGVFGEHQMGNALLVRRVCLALGISEKAIATGFKNTKLPVCLQVVSKKPIIILDGAHNPDKMNTTVKAVKDFAKSKPIHLVIGFAANKNLSGMVKKLAGLKPASIVCTRFTVNPFRKAADPRAIAGLFKKHLPKTQTNLSLVPTLALRQARVNEKLNPGGIILVTGSIFLSGELRQTI